MLYKPDRINKRMVRRIDATLQDYCSGVRLFEHAITNVYRQPLLSFQIFPTRSSIDPTSHAAQTDTTLHACPSCRTHYLSMCFQCFVVVTAPYVDASASTVEMRASELAVHLDKALLEDAATRRPYLASLQTLQCMSFSHNPSVCSANFA